MAFTITISAVTAFLVAILLPWRRASDLLRRAGSRAWRRCRAGAEQLFGKKSAHFPHHKPKRR